MALYRLKEIMGHADVKTTLIYAPLRPDTLKQEMERCFGAGYRAEQTEVERLRTALAEKEAECARLRAALDTLKAVSMAA